jgi:hypothetical protein
MIGEPPAMPEMQEMQEQFRPAPNSVAKWSELLRGMQCGFVGLGLSQRCRCAP